MRLIAYLIALFLAMAIANAQLNPNFGEEIELRCAEGDTICNGNLFQICVNANWQTAEECAYACNPQQGCIPMPIQAPAQIETPETESQNDITCYEDETRCVGNYIEMCSNNVWKIQQKCATNQECTSDGCISIPEDAMYVNQNQIDAIFLNPDQESQQAPIPEVLVLRTESLSFEPEPSPAIEKPKPKGLFGGFVELLKGLLGFRKTKIAAPDLTIGGYREEGLIIDVTQWYKTLPQEDITIDPVAGIVSLYWMDTSGVICNGYPGISGQPGIKEIIFPQSEEVYDTYIRKEPISLEDLAGLQKTAYYFDAYDGAGSHIIHFEPVFWRMKEDGRLIKGIAGKSMPISLHLDEEIVNPSTIKPYIVIKKNSACAYTMLSSGLAAMPAPALQGQHPTQCKKKSKITAHDLFSACLDDRIEGDFSLGYFKIKPKMIEYRNEEIT